MELCEGEQYSRYQTNPLWNYVTENNTPGTKLTQLQYDQGVNSGGTEQYTIMYRPDVFTVLTYLPSRRIYRFDVFTILTCLLPRRVYRLDVCTVPTLLPSRRM